MGWVSHLECFWTEPSFARFLRRLSEFSRLILFDKRGTGLSDRVGALPTLEQRMDDVRAVMAAAGSRRGGAARRVRGRADVQPVRDDLSGTDARADHDRHLRQAHVGARLSVGAGRRGARALLRRDPHELGRAGRHRDAGAEPRRRSGVPRVVEQLPAPGRQPRRRAHPDADERGDRRPPRPAARARADAGAAPLRRSHPARRGGPLRGEPRSGRAVRRAARRRPPAVRRRSGRHARSDRHVPRVRRRTSRCRIACSRRCSAPASRPTGPTTSRGWRSKRTCSRRSAGSAAAASRSRRRIPRGVRRPGSRHRLCARAGRRLSAPRPRRVLRPAHRRVRRHTRRTRQRRRLRARARRLQSSPPPAKCWCRAP